MADSKRDHARQPNLRILNVVDLGDERTRVVTAPGRPDLSVEPCLECPARCCEKEVRLSAPEAALLARLVGGPIGGLVEARAWSEADGLKLGWPFKLDDPDLGTRRMVLRLRRGDRGCLQLSRGAQGEPDRCGAYAARPTVCRLYPFTVEWGSAVGGRRRQLGFGHQGSCPTQWLQNAATRESAARDLERMDRLLDVDRQAIRFWNRRVRVGDRSIGRFFEFLTDIVAVQLTD